MLGAVSILGASTAAHATDPCDNNINLSSAGTYECVAPGTLGSGAYVAIDLRRFSGASGGGGYTDPYSTGGSGAWVDGRVSVPAGATVTMVIGGGGAYSRTTDMFGAGGGGSTALLVGSTLLLEAGGGGGGTSLQDWDGGDAGLPNGAGESGALSGVCGGRGGNTNGNGKGGAAGSTSGSGGAANSVSCAGSRGTVAGAAGKSATQGGAGGNGGSFGAVISGSGGTGYSPGGNGADMGLNSGLPVPGGSGGGGGYGGGGGGQASYSAQPIGGTTFYASSGAGGGGGSYLNPAFASGVISKANNGNYEDAGSDGRIRFYANDPVSVTTEVSPASDVTETSAIVHSQVNPGDVYGATPSVRYSTDPTMATGIQTATVEPTSIVTSAGDTPVTGTIGSGLKSCTKYYYQAVSASVSDPVLNMYGAVANFTTPGCSTALPLTVKARAAHAKLSRTGKTTVVTSAKTSAKGSVRIRVSCQKSTRGDVRYCTHSVRANGKVVVRTYGVSGVRVTVTMRAVPKAGQSATASRTWKRTWRVK